MKTYLVESSRITTELYKVQAPNAEKAKEYVTEGVRIVVGYHHPRIKGLLSTPVDEECRPVREFSAKLTDEYVELIGEELEVVDAYDAHEWTDEIENYIGDIDDEDNDLAEAYALQMEREEAAAAVGLES